MNADLAQELLNELGSSLEHLETQQDALLQFMKDKGLLPEDEFAPYLAQAGKASGVRWRVAHVRLDSLLSRERQEEEKRKENAEHQKGAAQGASVQPQGGEAKKSDEGDGDEAAGRSAEAKTNGAGEDTPPSKTV